MKVAIYTRFSSNNQSEMSTSAQIRACREFAEHSGMEIYKIYSDEAISGTEEKTDARQQYQKLLADARRHTSIHNGDFCPLHRRALPASVRQGSAVIPMISLK